MRLSGWIAAGAAALAVLALAGLGLAASGPVDASGLSPFAACTIGGPGTNYPNSELEPFVAVNPANPSNIVGVFQQDRWSNGGARGLVASTSHNGGSTWTESWAHFSTCSGGTSTSLPSTIDCRPRRLNWRRIITRSSGSTSRTRSSPFVAAATALKLATSMWSGQTRCSAPPRRSRP